MAKKYTGALLPGSIFLSVFIFICTHWEHYERSITIWEVCGVYRVYRWHRVWRRSALQVILNGKVIFSNNDRENDDNKNNQTEGLNQFKVVSFLAKFKAFSSFFQKHSKLTPFKRASTTVQGQEVGRKRR